MAKSLISKERVVAAFVVVEGVALTQAQKEEGENEAEAAQTEAEAEAAQTEAAQTEAVSSATTPRILSQIQRQRAV